MLFGLARCQQRGHRTRPSAVFEILPIWEQTFKSCKQQTTCIRRRFNDNFYPTGISWYVGSLWHDDRCVGTPNLGEVALILLAERPYLDINIMFMCILFLTPISSKVQNYNHNHLGYLVLCNMRYRKVVFDVGEKRSNVPKKGWGGS